MERPPAVPVRHLVRVSGRLLRRGSVLPLSSPLALRVQVRGEEKRNEAAAGVGRRHGHFQRSSTLDFTLKKNSTLTPKKQSKSKPLPRPPPGPAPRGQARHLRPLLPLRLRALGAAARPARRGAGPGLRAARRHGGARDPAPDRRRVPEADPDRRRRLLGLGGPDGGGSRRCRGAAVCGEAEARGRGRLFRGPRRREERGDGGHKGRLRRRLVSCSFSFPLAPRGRRVARRRRAHLASLSRVRALPGSQVGCGVGAREETGGGGRKLRQWWRQSLRRQWRRRRRGGGVAAARGSCRASRL